MEKLESNEIQNQSSPEQLQMIKQIGKTNYVVTICFSQTSKETIEDKIMRLIRNDIATENIS